MADSKLHLELGDIIEIKAQGDPKLNDKIFYINYIDNNEINLMNNENGDEIVLKIREDGSFENESITEIDLLDRASESGYARQNDLLPNAWINLYLGGDLPTTIIGKITNLEEDQIEISVWNAANKTYDQEPIYIDFGYKGLPKDIPITNIEIREAPPVDTELKEKVQEETPEIEVIERDDMGDTDDLVAEPEIKEQIRDLIFEADQIEFGEDLDVIAHEVDVPEEQRKYTLEKQTTDLLDDMLSNIPNKYRTSQIINNIHQIIERYKQLRKQFSTFDVHNNISEFKTHGDNHKPLVDVLDNFSKKVYWALPVSKLRKKLYNIENIDNELDMLDLDLGTVRTDESNLIQSYFQNDMGGDNKYHSLIRGLHNFYTPFEKPSIQQGSNSSVLANKTVGTNITSIVHNFSNFGTTVSKNDETKTKRFFIQEYIQGITGAQFYRQKGGNTTVSLHKITQNDTISVNSVMTLPEPVYQFSKINLPMSSILVKANLNNNFVNYWQLLTKNKTIRTQIIDNIEGETALDPHFLRGTSEYSLDEDIQDEDKYRRLLNSVFPTTTEVLEMFQDISGCLSMNSMLQHIEPFMIYQGDITKTQYNKIYDIVTANIDTFKKNFMKNQEKIGKIVGKYSIGSQEDFPYLLMLLGQELYDTFNDIYQFKVSTLKGFSNSSLLNYVTQVDYGKYYNTLIAKSTVSLMIPAGAEQIKKLEEFYISRTDSKQEEEHLAAATKDECKDYILSKKYQSLDELEMDNARTIYFDKAYDKTYYDLANETTYKAIISSEESQEDKIKSISEKLMENIGLELSKAVRDAKALVEKKREVIEGDYAVLAINDGRESKELYFVRKDGRWEADSQVTAEVFGNNIKGMCNLNEKCMIVKDNCETLENSEKQLKNKNLLQLINEFDTNMHDSQQDIAGKIDQELENSLKRLPGLIKLHHDKDYKYNNQKYHIGGVVDVGEQITSPHLKLRDAILGLTDFAKRQSFVCKFSTKFTRPANEGEDKWWKYCIDTNTKLLPTFIEELAVAFVNDDNYLETVARICRDQGKLSDDGEAWVDEHSGYFIKYIEFDTEEGFDEQGFKSSSRDIIEKENTGFLNIQSSLKKGTMSEETIMMQNVIVSIGNYMGLAIEPYAVEIIRDATSILNKHAPKKQESDKKKQAAYKKKYNTILILITLGCFFIYVQTSIPPLQTRKSFPGCKRSFLGYPMYGEENTTGLDYLSCVVSKISKSSIEPWSSIAGKNKEKVKILLKKVMDDYIVKTKLVQERIKKKIKYLHSNPEEIIPEDLNIKNWMNFMPPLVPIVLKKVENVSKVFREGLQTDIKQGKMSQFEKLQVMQSKIMYFSLEIVSNINDIVKKNVALLQNNNGEPYLENSCCDDGTINALQYFQNKNSQIKTNNRVVADLYDLVLTIGDMAKAPILFYYKNTKPIYPPLIDEFSEETIYRAFIAYCKFNTDLPIEPELQSICLEKPDVFNAKDSIQEKIEKLKAAGKRYGQQELQDLLSIVNKKNIVRFKLSYTVTSDLEKLRSLLEYSDSIDSSVFPVQFRTLFADYIDKYDIQQEGPSASEKFLDYLDVSSREMQEAVVNFLRKNLPRNRENKQIFECISTITDFKITTKDDVICGIDETTYKKIDYIKNVLRFICEVFPNIVLNKVDPCTNGCKIPKHWKLADVHNADLIAILNKYYENFNVLFDDDAVNYIFNKISPDNVEIYRYAMFTKYYSPIKDKGSRIKSIFSSELTTQLFKYYFFSALLNITGIVSNDDLSMEDPEEDPQAIKMISSLESGEPVEEEHLREGLVADNKTKAAKIIFVLCKIINSSKKVIDYNYESLMEKVVKLREQEKTDITDYLKEMTEDEREVENIFKSVKLEGWSVGSQKGFREYQSQTYEEERKSMERKMIMENKLGKENYITAQNKDIYLYDAMSEQANAEAIDSEVYSLAGLPNDDDYGDGDGDEYY